LPLFFTSHNFPKLSKTFKTINNIKISDILFHNYHFFRVEQKSHGTLLHNNLLHLIVHLLTLYLVYLAELGHIQAVKFFMVHKRVLTFGKEEYVSW